MGLEARVGRWTDQTTDGRPRQGNHPCPGRQSYCLISRENEDVGVGAERAECRFFGFGEVGSLWKSGRKFEIRDVS